jgi:dTMP kinase
MPSKLDRTTPIGQMINNYLQSKADLEDHVIHLLFSANRWELAYEEPCERLLADETNLFRKLIETEIAQGCNIICDRYTYSGMVYSAAKMNPWLDIHWARNPDVHLPRPDLVVFLDLNPDEAVKRGGYGDEKYEKREMQERVRVIFKCLKEYGQEETEDMVMIDAGGSVDEVSQKIIETARMKLAAVERGEMGKEIRRIEEWPQVKLRWETAD